MQGRAIRGRPAGPTVTTPIAMIHAHSDDERRWGMWLHLSGLVGYVVGLIFLGPLIIWCAKRDESAFLDDQGKRALNFSLTIMLMWVVTWLLSFVIVGFLIMPLLAVFHVACVVIATIKASRGEPFEYPVAIAFIR